MNCNDLLTIEYTSSNGRRRRVEYHPDPSGGYTRYVEERRGGSWRTVGTEPVTDVEVDSEPRSGEGDTNIGP